jgi:hypothetical protein
VSGADDALEAMAERLEDVLEELSDMAIDALSRATSGDPDSSETGDALAAERAILKARRGVEKSVFALREPARRARHRDHDAVDEGAD